MKEVRRLTLNAERLSELSTDEMRSVNGGASLPRTGCTVVVDVSDWVMSLCGCLTSYCSFDVC